MPIDNQPPPIVLTNGGGDGRVPLPQAESAIREAIADFFANAPAALKAKREYEGRCKLARMGIGRAPLWVPVMPICVAKVETGIGKTFGLVEVLAELPGRVAVAVPNHDLAEQTAADLRARGVNAEVYRGYDAKDPRSPGQTMCRDPVALKAAQALSVAVRKHVCVADDASKRCPFAGECGSERQRTLTARVWVFPAVMLTNQRPDFIPDFDALVIDEGFIGNCIAKPVSIPIAALINPIIGGPYNPTERAALNRARQWLVSVTMKMGVAGEVWLSRAALDAGAIDAEHAGWLADLERRRISAGDLAPGMSAAALRETVKLRGADNKEARALADLWRAIESFRIEGHDLSGRIRIEDGAVTVTALQHVHPDWHLPALILDATPPPDLTLIDIAFGAPDGTATVVADVRAKWPKHVEVRQLLGATVSKNGLGLLKDQKPARLCILNLLRRVRMLAAEAAPSQIGLIAQKDLLDRIRDLLPSNVIARHFGALAGMNDMRDVAGLVVIGRQSPRSADVERDAGVWLGYPVQASGFEPVRAMIVDRVVAVDRHRHPLVEALRWLVTDAGLYQAVGRLRAQRRPDPCFLEIINDVVLDLPGIVASDWQAPGAVADMMAAGLLFENRRDAAALYDLSDRASKDAAEVVREVGVISLYRNPYREMTPTSTNQPAGAGRETNQDRRSPAKTRRIRYRKTGPGQKINQCLVMPYVLTGGARALRELLETKLDPLALLEIDRVRAKDTEYGRSILERAARTIEELVSEDDDATDAIEQGAD